MEHERLIKPTVSYHLFLYREELARRNARQLRLSRTKIEITDELISKTVKNIKMTLGLDTLVHASLHATAALICVYYVWLTKNG